MDMKKIAITSLLILQAAVIYFVFRQKESQLHENPRTESYAKGRQELPLGTEAELEKSSKTADSTKTIELEIRKVICFEQLREGKARWVSTGNAINNVGTRELLRLGYSEAEVESISSALAETGHQLNELEQRNAYVEASDLGDEIVVPALDTSTLKEALYHKLKAILKSEEFTKAFLTSTEYSTELNLLGVEKRLWAIDSDILPRIKLTQKVRRSPGPQALPGGGTASEFITLGQEFPISEQFPGKILFDKALNLPRRK
jgi:hypothetical protein